MRAVRSLHATTAAIALLEAELEATLAACRPKQRPPLEAIRQRLIELKAKIRRPRLL